METQTPNVGLTKIRSFVAVAQTRQFRKAAEALGLSQPALSAHIRALEHELGAALFMRTTRSVTLTAEGERFLRCARSILKELDRAICELRDQAQLKTGRVVVAATPSVAANVLPKALAAFKARHPDVQLHVREEPAAGVERRVEAGDADFGAIVASKAADCGPCLQLGISMADAAGVAPSVVRAALRDDREGLPESARLAYDLARSVVARDGSGEAARTEILRRYGHRALVSLAYAMVVANAYPTLKYALGYGHTCARVRVGGEDVTLEAAAAR